MIEPRGSEPIIQRKAKTSIQMNIAPLEKVRKIARPANKYSNRPRRGVSAGRASKNDNMMTSPAFVGLTRNPAARPGTAAGASMG